MSEQLDKNPFYRTLVKEFSDVYCELNSNQWILCIPTVTCLQGVHIDRKFITLHILKPSLLLKWHYLPLNSEEVSDVEIDNTFITITRNDDESHKEVVRIIGEEIAYNCFNKPYKIYVVSSPFIKNFQRKTETQSPRFKKNLLSFTECESYLNCLSTDTTKCIEKKTKELSKSYLILPSYLDDAAMRFQAVIDWGIKRFDEVERELVDENEDLAIAVESFVIGCVYNKVFEAVKKRFAVEDDVFYKNSIELNSCKFTPVDLGAQEVFKAVELRNSFADDLLNLEFEETPLQKIHTLKKVVDNVNRALSDHIKKLRSPFGSFPQVSVVGDDLVACVVYLLCTTAVKYMVSNMSFIQLFGGHLSQKNEFGYSLVTFEVAVEFIKRFEKSEKNENDIPESHEQNNSSVCEENCQVITENTNASPIKVVGPAINSELDSQLENISRFITISDESNGLRTAKTDEDNDLGDFLSSLSKKHYYVGAGKQTK